MFKSVGQQRLGLFNWKKNNNLTTPKQKVFFHSSSLHEEDNAALFLGLRGY